MVVYHHVNAYEDDGHVVFDVIAYKDKGLYDMFFLSKLNTNTHDDAYSKPGYKRFALPIHSDKVGFFILINLFILKFKKMSPLMLNTSFLSVGHCCWRGPGETQIHNSQRCEGERRQTAVPGRGAL